jgi:hypothetical protein
MQSSCRPQLWMRGSDPWCGVGGGCCVSCPLFEVIMNSEGRAISVVLILDWLFSFAVEKSHVLVGCDVGFGGSGFGMRSSYFRVLTGVG